MTNNKNVLQDNNNKQNWQCNQIAWNRKLHNNLMCSLSECDVISFATHLKHILCSTTSQTEWKRLTNELL